jgi:hypothetical protein
MDIATNTSFCEDERKQAGKPKLVGEILAELLAQYGRRFPDNNTITQTAVMATTAV